MGFYRGWSKDDIKKLQSFLSRKDMLGDDTYKGEVDGIMGPKTIAAIKAYQKKQGVTADGMWGVNTEKHHNAMGSSDVVAKSPYKKSHRYEAGNFVKHPTAYSEFTWHDLPRKNVAAAIDYFMSYPEMLFSEDMEASKWRQIFHNSGKEGADFINTVFAMLSPEQRKLVDDRRLTESYKIDRMQRQINEKRNEFAGNLLPALIAPVAGATTLSALVGGAALPTIAGLAGGYAGSQIFGEVGKRIGRKQGIKDKDKLYTDPIADKYGVASAVYDPNRRIAEAEQKGQTIGSLSGALVGGVGGTALGTATENAVINTMGAGRAAYAPKAPIVEETVASARPYGSIELGTVKYPSRFKLFTEGVKARLSTKPGQQRAGGVYGVKHRYNGKTYHPGNWMDDATAAEARQDWANPLSPYRMKIGGTKNLGKGVKIGQSMAINWPGVVAQTGINTPTHVVGTTIANQGDVVLDPTNERE